MRLVRLLAIAWSAPTSMLGIAASLASLAMPKPASGVLQSTSGRGFANWFLTRRGYSAITLGHVVILTPQAPADVIRHELVHVRQCQLWGPFFVPAYLIAMLATWIRGGNPYWDNPFEAEARAKASPRQ